MKYSTVKNTNFLFNCVKISGVNLVKDEDLKIHTKSLLKNNNEKKGIIFIKSTKGNVFCILMDSDEKKVKTSCSLRVPVNENKYNERENLYTRGLLLGNLFGEKAIELGYTEFTIFLGSGINKGRRGVMRGFSKKGVKIVFLQLGTQYPHNGCRPLPTP